MEPNNVLKQTEKITICKQKLHKNMVTCKKDNIWENKMEFNGC